MITARDNPDLQQRNRKVARVLLTIVAALAIASLLVGIRW
jgi:hypothetical protein